MTDEDKKRVREAFNKVADSMYENAIRLYEQAAISFPDSLQASNSIEKMLIDGAKAMESSVTMQINSIINQLKEADNGKE